MTHFDPPPARPAAAATGWLATIAALGLVFVHAADAADAAGAKDAAAAAAKATPTAAAATTKPAAAKPAQVARGKYLVSTAGCHDCHTPWHIGAKGEPEPDMSRALSGHPEQLQMPPAPTLPEGPWLVISGATNTSFAGPWGVSFTANLTPDADTGLGAWSQRDFMQTIRTGKHMGRGRDVLPPMPIMVYNNFTDADLASIYAYLRTIPPVKNRVPEPRPPVAR